MFLLGMTLNELAFLLFFLLLIISTALIKEQSKELQSKSDQLTQMKTRLDMTQIELDQNFKKLQLIDSALQPYAAYRNSTTVEDLNRFFSKLVAAEQKNQDLNNFNEEIKQLQKYLNQISSFQHLQTRLIDSGLDKNPFIAIEDLINRNDNLSRDNRNHQGQIAFLQKQSRGNGNGLDHTPCWADPVTGDIEYLYRITLLGDKLQISDAWPEKRAHELRTIPGAIRLTGKTITREEFMRLAYPVFKWSQELNCRHFIRIRDTPGTSKQQYKNNLLGIESYFYKYLER